MARPRVVVIGFHGGGPFYTQPLLDAHRLPMLERLAAEGITAPTVSPWPVSAACWVTLLTGLDVAQHGVLDVCECDARWFPSQSARPIDARAYADQTFLTLASNAGRSVAGLGVPMTGPSFPVNGVLLPSFPIADERFPPTFPPNLLADFGPVSLCRADEVDIRDLQACRAYLDFDLDRMGLLGQQVYQSRDWDVFMLVFKVPDLVNHLFCDSPYHPGWRDVIDEYVVTTDAAVGRFLSIIDRNSTVIILSDHGSGPMPHTIFRVSRWLENEGLLVRRHAGVVSQTGLERLHRGYRTLRADRYARHIRRWLPDAIVDRVRSVGHQWPFVDLGRTRVYPVEMFYPLAGFQINRAGREAQGIVDDSEFERQRQALIARLRSLKLPASDGPLFRNVFTREELFDGAFAERLPDVVGELDPDVDADQHFAPELFAPNAGKPAMPYRGYHSRDSLFLMSGPGLPAGRVVTGAHLRDFMPTLLRVIGVPVPAGCRGRYVPDLS